MIKQWPISSAWFGNKLQYEKKQTGHVQPEWLDTTSSRVTEAAWDVAGTMQVQSCRLRHHPRSANLVRALRGRLLLPVRRIEHETFSHIIIRKSHGPRQVPHLSWPM